MEKNITWNNYEKNIIIKCEKCGWKNNAKNAKLNRPDETVAEVNCPKCGATIGLINLHESINQIRKNADRGDKWSKNYLKTQKSIENTLLKSPEQLDDLNDDKMNFIWDAEGKEPNVWTIIKLNDKIIWKEKAYFNGEKRFEEIKKILKLKYGKKFNSLEINEDNPLCVLYYYGD